MAVITYNNVGIKAMSACVPSKIVSNQSLSAFMSDDEVEKMINSVGIHERRVCDEDVCASDLCYKAAMKLMEDNAIEPGSIDMLLFMSQCADYKVPATSCILQHRLGLPKTVACLDLSLACSGYVYGLSAAFAYTSMTGINRVLLLDGETFTKYVNPKDKVNVPLYGDAGTATLIEKGNYEPSVFILNTDGSGEDAVKIPHGGCRHPFTSESYVIQEREEGNLRSDAQLYMDGMDVFNFAIGVVPKGVRELMEVMSSSLERIDYLLFHQANKFMTDFFVKRLKLDPEKVPYSISKFGNTSSASIPLTIVSELEGKLDKDKFVVMCGFGAGLSWATAGLVMHNCKVSRLVEY